MRDPARIETAFLECHLRENYKIFLKAPEGMEIQVQSDECLEIKKGMYGLVQASRLYFIKFAKYMTEELGFKQCQSEQCLLFKFGKKSLMILRKTKLKL